MTGEKGGLLAGLRAEALKSRHAAPVRLAGLMALPMPRLGAMPYRGVQIFSAWNYWYALFLPVSLSLVVACVARADARTRMRGLLGLGFPLGRAWWAKALWCLALCALSKYLSHSVEAWQGLTFELLCLFHISQIRKALNIGGVASEAYIWFDKADKTKNQRGAQIDLIIERADRVINLCEMKFSQAQYKISADYEIKLRNRMELFRDRTHCTKSLVNTFVTTFGVANGIHSSIVNSEVTLDNLFQE